MKKIAPILSLLLLLLAVTSFGNTINVQGIVKQFGAPVPFHKVYFKGDGFDTFTLTNNRGTFQIQLNTTKNEGVFAVFTQNCLGDTLSAIKEYDPSTNKVEVVFNRCASIQNIVVKGRVTYGDKGLPNHKVRFCFNSPQAVTDSVITDSNGYFLKPLVSATQSSGVIYAKIENCDGQEEIVSGFYNVEDTTVFNFDYCNGGHFKILTGRVLNDQINMKKYDFTLNLYQQNPQSGQLEFVQSEPSGYQGTFKFLLSRDSKYIIKAVPKNEVFAVPTYYGNSSYWNKAIVISMMDTINVIDIPVKSTVKNSGSSTIEGFVSDRRKVLSSIHTVYLLDETDNFIDFAVCSEQGAFQFSNVPIGSYKLYTDVVGLPTTPMQLNVNEENQLAGLTILVNRKEVTFENPLSINHNNNPLNSYAVYPNPFNDNLTFKVENEKFKQIQVVDISGKIVHEATIAPLSSSIINTDSWDNGFYIVNVYEENQLLDTKKLIK